MNSSAVPPTAPRPTPAREPSAAKTRRGFPWVTTIVVLLVAGGVAYYFLRPAAAPDKGGRPSRPIPVAAVAARSGELHVYLTAIGSVSAWNTVTVRSRADGQLLKLHFDEGQHVQEGDLLAEIDPRAYQVGLEQAEGQLARDQALQQNAQQDLERYQNAQEAVTPQQVDSAKAAVAQYIGIVRTDQGNVDNYKLQLSYCRITAPAAGRTGIRLVDEGNLIHASDSTGIVVITQDQPIAALFSIPQVNLPQVRKAVVAGQSLPVDAYNLDLTQILATGSVIAMDNQIDVTTGTVRLKARFENNDGALFPNQGVNMRLLVEVQQNATLIPVQAVQINGATRFVFVVKSDNTVEQRTVTLGKTEGDTVAVATGVKPGEVVVTEGLDKLQNGSPVAARLPGAPAPDSAATPDATNVGKHWGKKKGDAKGQ